MDNKQSEASIDDKTIIEMGNCLNKFTKTNRNQLQSYDIVRNVSLLAIGFGLPIHHWFAKNDKFGIFFERYSRILLVYRIYCWVLIHLALLLNIVSLMSSMNGANYIKFSHSLMQLAWNLSSAVAINSFHYNRHRNNGFFEDICDNWLINNNNNNNHNNNNNNNGNDQQTRLLSCNKFLRPVNRIFQSIRPEKRTADKVCILFLLFGLPIIFTAILIANVVIDISSLTREHFLYPILAFNTFAVFAYILIIAAFSTQLQCLCNSLLKYVDTLIADKNMTVKQLDSIAKSYAHIYAQVKRFANTFSSFVITFYILNIINISAIVWAIIFVSSIGDDNHILLYLTLAFSTTLGLVLSYILVFKSSRSVDTVLCSTRKLIEKYVTCTEFEIRSIEFNSEYNHFYLTTFSKASPLSRITRLLSITKKCLVIGIILAVIIMPNTGAIKSEIELFSLMIHDMKKMFKENKVTISFRN